ncbi:MAG TPA: hypothetical protein PK022_03990 [Syntrophales bacterium]|nr:hypothetical protein [Syntrophales bacterium]
MKQALLFSLIWLILGCTSAPAPDWMYQSYNALDSYKSSILEGKSTLADLYFERAVAETKRSGDLILLGRVYLTQMAMETVLQHPHSENAFLAILKIAPDPENEQYYRFLQGKNYGDLIPALLPGQYRDFAAALQQKNEEAASGAIGRIKDPCSQIISISVCDKWRLCKEQEYRTAIDTASRQGWKAVLQLYLEKLAGLQDARGEKEQAGLTREKLDLLKD